MNYKVYKELEEYYFEVVKHLFKSKETFKEFLTFVATEGAEELIGKGKGEFDTTVEELLEFIDNISTDDTQNTTKKNKLVKHSVSKGYEVFTYNLQPYQSYTNFDKTVNRLAGNNFKKLYGNIQRVIVDGILSTTDNTRVYVYFDNN